MKTYLIELSIILCVSLISAVTFYSFGYLFGHANPMGIVGLFVPIVLILFGVGEEYYDKKERQENARIKKSYHK